MLPSRFTCRSVRRLLWEYAAERLSEGPMETVERHLAACGRCRRELDALRRAQGLLVAFRRQDLPASQSNWNMLRQRLLTEAASAPAPIGSSANGDAGGLSHVSARHSVPAMVSSVAVVTAIAGIGFGVFGTKIALEAKPPLLPGEQRMQAAGGPPSAGGSEPFSLPATQSVLFSPLAFNLLTPRTIVGTSAGQNSAHSLHKPSVNASKPVHTVKSKGTPPNKESSQAASKAGTTEMRRPEPAAKAKQIKPAADSAAGRASEEPSVTVPHRYILGTLTPVPREDDSPY